MTEQLDLLPAPKRAKKSPVEGMCRCGHDVREHTTKGRGCFVCKDECKRFKTRSRKAPVPPPWLAMPIGGVPIIRQDTAKPKPCGWAWLEPGFGTNGAHLLAYLDHLECKSPNARKNITNAVAFGKLRADRAAQMIAGLSLEEKAQRERAMLALETVHAELLGRPRKVRLERVDRVMDGDNLQGALKHIRDGVAEGLLEKGDDLFNGLVPIEYACARPGKQGVYGVRIEVWW